MPPEQDRVASTPPEFRLLWTIGFSGKRRLSAEESTRLRHALDTAIEHLLLLADAQDAGLTAVSSIARGADVEFAESVLAARPEPLPWKCVLPFEPESFLDHDTRRLDGSGVSADPDRAALAVQARKLIALSMPAAIVEGPLTDPASEGEREQAYLECGYRIVAESDVLIIALRKAEITTLLSTRDSPHPAATGSIAVARYAMAGSHPTILLDVDAEDPWASRKIVNEPERDDWFVATAVTSLVREAGGTSPAPDGSENALTGPTSARRLAVHRLHRRLDELATRRQARTLSSLREIVHLHFVASLLAVGAAVVFKPLSGVSFVIAAAIYGIALCFAFTEPALAGVALWIERRLHRARTREEWLLARVLAEITRGAVATWPLPNQPDDALDEEDFPHVKRLVRSLRLWRDGDVEANATGSTIASACADYTQQRLRDQEAYYERHGALASERQRRWRGGFLTASVTAVVASVTLATHHVFPFAAEWQTRLLEATSILTPIVAAYCLATMSILDLPRRSSRYREMVDALRRIDRALSQAGSDRTRLRLVEKAERILVEEQHEWFSTIRNLHV